MVCWGNELTTKMICGVGAVTSSLATRPPLAFLIESSCWEALSKWGKIIIAVHLSIYAYKVAVGKFQSFH